MVNVPGDVWLSMRARKPDPLIEAAHEIIALKAANASALAEIERLTAMHSEAFRIAVNSQHRCVKLRAALKEIELALLPSEITNWLSSDGKKILKIIRDVDY